MGSSSPTLHRSVGRSPINILAPVHRNWLIQRCHRMQPAPHAAPRPAICTRLGLWLLRYERTPLHRIVRFSQSRQVLTGRPPFFNANKITAACSMIVNARRPSRLDHLEIPEPQWYIIERCWDNEPLKRMSAREALGLLQAEARRTSNLANDPVPT